MTNGTDTRPKSKAEREANLKARRRVEQASIVEGLRTILDSNEQLLGFARGRIAGGWRGKLSVGPEAFFAPFVNIALTERRFVLQHIHVENGRPSEILPHFFDLSEVAALLFSDIETFGGEPASRLILRLKNDQEFRLRLGGQTNVESAQTMAEVFRSLTSARRTSPTTPTQRVCVRCHHILDNPMKFCPYCGTAQIPEGTANEVRTDMPPAQASVADATPAFTEAQGVHTTSVAETPVLPESDVFAVAVPAVSAPAPPPPPAPPAVWPEPASFPMAPFSVVPPEPAPSAIAVSPVASETLPTAEPPDVVETAYAPASQEASDARSGSLPDISIPVEAGAGSLAPVESLIPESDAEEWPEAAVWPPVYGEAGSPEEETPAEAGPFSAMEPGDVGFTEQGLSFFQTPPATSATSATPPASGPGSAPGEQHAEATPSSAGQEE